MWLIVGGTVGLAQFVTRAKQHATIELEPPIEVGQLLVRMPKGWLLHEVADSQISAQDPETEQVIAVAQEQSPPDARTNEPDEPRPGSQSAEPIRFGGLREQGWMQVVQLRRIQDGMVIQDNFLMAEAITPDGLTVAVQLRQSGPRVGAADRQLLQAVVNGITRAPGAARTPPRQKQPVRPREGGKNDRTSDGADKVI